MPKVHVAKGKTSKRLKIFVQDSSATTGIGLSGLVFNSAGLTCYYIRDGAASTTVVTLVTATVGTYTSSGFKEVDATNMKGVYELDIPDAAFATGADEVLVYLQGATDMAAVVLEVQLTDFDMNEGVRGALTALPNAAAEAAGGLYTRGAGAGQINQPANGEIDGNIVKWLGTAPLALSSQRVQTHVANMAANVITAAAINAAAITAAKFGAGAIDAAAIAADAITAAKIAADAIGASELATDAVNEIRDAIFDALLSSFTTSGSFGELFKNAMVRGTVDTGTFTPTTTQFEADDITEATADHYNGRVVLWTSGALKDQVTDITDYELSGSNGKFTVTAMTEAPANNDTFVII